MSYVCFRGLWGRGKLPSQAHVLAPDHQMTPWLIRAPSDWWRNKSTATRKIMEGTSKNMALWFSFSASPPKKKKTLRYSNPLMWFWYMTAASDSIKMMTAMDVAGRNTPSLTTSRAPRCQLRWSSQLPWTTEHLKRCRSGQNGWESNLRI